MKFLNTVNFRKYASKSYFKFQLNWRQFLTTNSLENSKHFHTVEMFKKLSKNVCEFNFQSLAHFYSTGNYPEKLSVQFCRKPGKPTYQKWFEFLIHSKIKCPKQWQKSFISNTTYYSMVFVKLLTEIQSECCICR
jgi:hypothetical protein